MEMIEKVARWIAETAGYLVSSLVYIGLMSLLVFGVPALLLFLLLRLFH